MRWLIKDGVRVGKLTERGVVILRPFVIRGDKIYYKKKEVGHILGEQLFLYNIEVGEYE